MQYGAVEKNGKATQAMVCEITPQKTCLKVAVKPKERPFLVEISSLHEPVPQVLQYCAKRMQRNFVAFCNFSVVFNEI